MTQDTSQLRSACQRTGIEYRDLAADPITQFKLWYEQWTGINPYDPSAVVLATADRVHRPSVRWVRLTQVDRGFIFFTDYRSRKATDLAVNPQAALCFGWLELARQVRVDGIVSKLSAVESDTYFAGLPRDIQLLLLASDQRSVIPDREILRQRVRLLDGEFAGRAIQRARDWGGYRLIPEEIEFWQGREDNLNDRFRYRRNGADAPWRIERVSP